MKLLPSVAIQHLFLGETQVYMRGVASGSNGNHSGPLPSVGMYLDGLRTGADVGARHANLRRSQAGELRDGKRRNNGRARQNNQQRAHRREHRTLDEKINHRLCTWTALPASSF